MWINMGFLSGWLHVVLKFHASTENKLISITKQEVCAVGFFIMQNREGISS